MTTKIALLQPIAGEMADIIQSLLPEGFTASAVKGRSVEDLKAEVADATYALWWDVPVPAEVLAAGLPHRRGLLLLVRHQAAQLLARANQPRPSCSSLSASRRVRLPCRPRGGHHVA